MEASMHCEKMRSQWTLNYGKAHGTISTTYNIFRRGFRLREGFFAGSGPISTTYNIFRWEFRLREGFFAGWGDRFPD
jgi:hypothetical protein